MEPNKLVLSKEPLPSDQPLICPLCGEPFDIEIMSTLSICAACGAEAIDIIRVQHRNINNMRELLKAEAK
jgi:hypothetical protein